MNARLKMLNFITSIKKSPFWWLCAVIFLIALFIKLSSELLFGSELQKFDQTILTFIGQNIRSSSYNSLAVDLTAFGSPSVILVVTTISLFALFLLKDKIGAFYLVIMVSGGGIWTLLLKRYFDRNRPTTLSRLVEVKGQSFPSGHALSSTATYFAIALLICKYTSSQKISFFVLALAAIIVLLTSLSRLYLGVHYPSDVLSGIVFGLAWVIFVTEIFKFFSNQQQS